MSKLPKLQMSANHEQFVQSEFNRDLRNLNGLRKSMQTHGYIAAYPLHCARGAGGKLVIKAGHHRFEAAKQLGIPVYYVITDDQSTIVETELTANSWSFTDYVKSYARAGSDAHIAIMQFAERTGISFNQSASLLGGECASSGNLAPKVKSGTFSVKENGHADKVARIVTELKSMGIRFATNAGFVAAVSSVCWLPEFDIERFLKRSANNLHLFEKKSTKAQYIDLIEVVYNFSSVHRIAVAFLAREAAKTRTAIQKKTH